MIFTSNKKSIRKEQEIMSGTIQEIAKLVGVSRGTVDRALNERGRVNPEVADRIFKIANEIGYVPKRKMKAGTKQNIKIGIVTQLSKASFMIQIKKGIEDAGNELSGRSIELLLEECMTVDEGEQQKALDKLIKQGVDAIAIMPVESNAIRNRINEIVEKLNIPIVTFNSDIVGTKRSHFVGLNNKQSGRTAAGLMGMMTGGKGKVLAITGYFGNSVGSMRVDGFVEEIRESFPEMEIIGVQSSFDKSEEVERLIVNAMNTFPDLDGIVVFSSGQAGIQKAFERLELKKRPYVIIYDLTPKNIETLQDNTADFLIDQSGYTQGYRTLFILADMLQKGQKGKEEFLYTDITIKTKYNV